MNRIAVCMLVALLPSVAFAESIRGSIVDESGAPIEGATVVASDGLSTTAIDGQFELRVSPSRVHSVQIQADGYYDARHTFATGIEAGQITLVARRSDRRLLLFAGDAMLARRYFDPTDDEPVLVRKGREFADATAILATIRPYIELADYASVNLETQLSSNAPKQRLPKSVTFYSPPEFAKALEWAGFDYVALGNNHTWDYQAEGLQSTVAALEETGLGYSGAGFDEATARGAFDVDLDHQAYSFLSYVGWAGTFSPSQAAKGAKGGAALGGSGVFAEDLPKVPGDSVSVLQYHSGLEYSAMPAVSERQRLREAIDAGADIAIGHHAHVLQGIEIHRNRLVAYSMGNFLFDQYHYTPQLGMLLYVWMDGDELHRAEVVPMHVNGYVPTPATGDIRYSILHRLARLSQPFGTCLRRNGAHAIVESCDGAEKQSIALGDATPGDIPVHLSDLGREPFAPVNFSSKNHQYRLGTDILRRGDFEYSGLFGAHDRGWITSDDVAIVDRESRQLRVLTGERTVRTGMKVFERVFSPSNPTTVSGRVHTDGPAVIRFRLQRRRIDDAIGDALKSGPLSDVGGLRVQSAGWHHFKLDFDQPRLTTRSVRLLIDVSDDAPPTRSAREVVFDDLSWVEWRTPWLDGEESGRDSEFATHVQFRPQP